VSRRQAPETRQCYGGGFSGGPEIPVELIPKFKAFLKLFDPELELPE
jgi:hypothetical protein